MNITVTLSKTSPICNILTIVSETEKAYKVYNREENASCFIPKSALIADAGSGYHGLSALENNYYLAGWFVRKMDRFQEKVLGIAN